MHELKYWQHFNFYTADKKVFIFTIHDRISWQFIFSFAASKSVLCGMLLDDVKIVLFLFLCAHFECPMFYIVQVVEECDKCIQCRSRKISLSV